MSDTTNPTYESVTCKSITIVDDEGNPTIWIKNNTISIIGILDLTMDDQGLPRIVVRDRNSDAKVCVTVVEHDDDSDYSRGEITISDWEGNEHVFPMFVASPRL